MYAQPACETARPGEGRGGLSGWFCAPLQTKHGGGDGFLALGYCTAVANAPWTHGGPDPEPRRKTLSSMVIVFLAMDHCRACFTQVHGCHLQGWLLLVSPRPYPKIKRKTILKKQQVQLCTSLINHLKAGFLECFFVFNILIQCSRTLLSVASCDISIGTFR